MQLYNYIAGFFTRFEGKRVITWESYLVKFTNTDVHSLVVSGNSILLLEDNAFAEHIENLIAGAIAA